MQMTYFITPDQTVAEVVQKYPETIPAWIALNTGCLGCHLMRFCSLEYVAEIYKMRLETLIKDLEKTIRI